MIGNVGFGFDFGSRHNISKSAKPSFAPTVDVFDAFTGAVEEGFKQALNPLRRYLKFLPVRPLGPSRLLCSSPGFFCCIPPCLLAAPA